MEPTRIKKYPPVPKTPPLTVSVDIRLRSILFLPHVCLRRYTTPHDLLDTYFFVRTSRFVLTSGHRLGPLDSHVLEEYILICVPSLFGSLYRYICCRHSVRCAVYEQEVLG